MRNIEQVLQTQNELLLLMEENITILTTSTGCFRNMLPYEFHYSDSNNS